MPALTRAEAETRARLIDVHHYAIDLDLTRGDEIFGSTTLIRFSTRPDAGPALVDSFAEIRPATLHRVTLDGHALDPACLDGNRLPLTGLTPGEHELLVEADMRYSTTGEGMHRFTDPADGETYTFTHLFMEDVQRVTAAFDQPDLKAVFAVTVTAPAAWTVLGNGIAERTAEGRWSIAATPPISTYLLAVAAGPWHSVRTEHAGLPFGLHCRSSLAPHLDTDTAELLDITRRCFDRYHEIFDEPYPFDSYDQLFVPEFNPGAMENPGLVVFRDDFVHRSAVTDTERQFRGVVIAHEMAHMWFGDLVTLRWWDDIWLNESFAEYMGFQVLAEATRFTDTWTDFAVTRKGWGYDADQRPSTHPVAPDPEAVPDTASALVNFDGISYAKGASALRQLVAWLGAEDFTAGINNHFARHRFGNATLADFIASLADATDRDVHSWARAWLRTTGPDTLTSAVTAGDGQWQLTIGHAGNRPHHVAVGLYDQAAADPGTLVRRETVACDIPADAATHTLTLGGPRPDFVLLNDGDLTYAKTRFDAGSRDTLRDALSGLPDPLSRAVAWNAVRDLVRDGDLAPADHLDLVIRHLPAENDPAVVQGVLTFTRTQSIDHYSDPARRAGRLTLLAATCRDLLHGPAAGTHLSAARTLVDSAVTEGDADALRRWLDDGRIPSGPVLDPELRWRILLRLAVLGAATAADIDAELTRDPSATGRQSAARCRAARPEQEAKRDAWQAMFGGDTLSNHLFTATAQGFWQPEHQGLTAGYVPRYFPDAAALAHRRGVALAEAAGSDAFPWTAVDADTLRLGREALRDLDVTPALARKLADQLDDLERALRIRTIHG